LMSLCFSFFFLFSSLAFFCVVHGCSLFLFFFDLILSIFMFGTPCSSFSSSYSTYPSFLFDVSVLLLFLFFCHIHQWLFKFGIEYFKIGIELFYFGLTHNMVRASFLPMFDYTFPTSQTPLPPSRFVLFSFFLF
jgi:hypothetical protein